MSDTLNVNEKIVFEFIKSNLKKNNGYKTINGIISEVEQINSAICRVGLNVFAIVAGCENEIVTETLCPITFKRIEKQLLSDFGLSENETSLENRLIYDFEVITQIANKLLPLQNINDFLEIAETTVLQMVLMFPSNNIAEIYLSNESIRLINEICLSYLQNKFDKDINQ